MNNLMTVMTNTALTTTFSTWDQNHHESYSQGVLLYLFQGDGELQTANQSLTLQPKQTVLIPHHTGVFVNVMKPLSVMVCTWPQFEIMIADGNMVQLPNRANLDAIINLLVKEKKQSVDHNQAMISLGNLLRIVCLRNCDHPLQFQAPKASSHECEVVNDYLAENYRESITLDQLAALVHMNKYALVHLYQRVMGHTIMEELKQIRLLHAQEQLTHGDEAIKDIARACGFASAAYFIESFRSRYQITPLQYRKAQRRKKQ